MCYRMLPFDDYLFDKDGNRVVISLSKFGRETSGPRSEDFPSQSRNYGPVDRTYRDRREEEEFERPMRVLTEFRPDSTTMQVND